MAWPTIDWTQLISDLRTAVFTRTGAYHRFTVRRLTVLLVVGLLFAYAQVSIRLFWLLDALLFPAWRHQRVERPLFVVGNFRSGTTLLFRMLSRGIPTASSPATWEIYLAPTVSQRLFWRTAAAVDRALGSPIGDIVRRMNRRLRSVPYHPIDLFEPEEDAGALLYVWSGFFTWFVFPRRDVVPAVSTLDTFPPRRRRSAIRFYRDLMRKHLYAHARRRRRSGRAAATSPRPIFLSKNPAFTGAMAALREEFPDARFVVATRDAEATLRSTMRWFGVWFALLGGKRGVDAPHGIVSTLVEGWYRHPVAFDVPHVHHGELIQAPREQLARLAEELDIAELGTERAFRRAAAELERDHGSGGSAVPYIPNRGEDSYGSLYTIP